MIVGVRLAEEAEEVIEPLPVRHAFVARQPQTPFADEARCVAGLLQHFGDGHVLVAQHLRVADSPSPHCRERACARYAGPSSARSATARKPSTRHRTA